MINKLQLTLNKIDKRWAMALALALAVVLVSSVSTYASNGVFTTPTLSLDFDAALSYIFQYAQMIFDALLPVAAIGIGFTFGIALLSYVGSMISKSIRAV